MNRNLSIIYKMTGQATYTFEKPANWMTLLLYQKIIYSHPFVIKYYQKYMDKLYAKKFVKEICGDKIHVARLVRVLCDYTDVRHDDLNENYMIKSNLNSGNNINIISTEKMTETDVKHKLELFNKRNVHTIQQQFFIEEKIECKYTGKSGNALTFIFRCIHGIPYTFTIRNKNIDQNTHYLIDSDCNLTLISMNYKDTNQIIYKNCIIPEKENIKKMYDLAGLLAKPFEFVRMDFYIEKNDDIYFSEYTFFPATGKKNFSIDIETMLGCKWT